jgi:hypothetical protein
MTRPPETTGSPQMAGPPEDPAPISDQDLEALLKRAILITIVVGVLAALALWIGSNWRNAAMMATGTAISAASIYEWRRLSRFIAAKMDHQAAPRGVALPILFFLFRLMIFAAAIYVSLKCFRGSAVALLCGLSLAVLSLLWEALRLLRN